MKKDGRQCRKASVDDFSREVTACGSNDPKLTMEAVTDATFASTVLQSDKPVIVDFWAEWCGPCRRLSPILEEVASELGESVSVLKLNTDENPEAPGKYVVMSIPTLIIFKDGNEVGRTVGLMAKGDLKDKIKAAIG
jgi:thioredoxin 1